MEYWEYNKLQLNCRALRFISWNLLQLNSSLSNSDFFRKIITNNNYVHKCNKHVYVYVTKQFISRLGVENEISQSCL